MLLARRLVLWMGCLCCFCGYTGLYLMASGKAPNNFPQLLVFAIAAGARSWLLQMPHCAPRGSYTLAMLATQQSTRAAVLVYLMQFMLYGR